MRSIALASAALSCIIPTPLYTSLKLLILKYNKMRQYICFRRRPFNLPRVGRKRARPNVCHINQSGAMGVCLSVCMYSGRRLESIVREREKAL